MMTFFRRIDLSNRPLLLLCGEDGSGKTTLLAKSGLACEYLHSDSGSMSRRDTPAWFFLEKAVYVSGIGESVQKMSRSEDKEQTRLDDKKQEKSRKNKQTAPVSRLEASILQKRLGDRADECVGGRRKTAF
jgi:Flp pilus assembly CpaF family ATPase